MAIEVGSIIEGKVSGIMPFGAFIALPDNKVGLLHISEASTTYIKDINEHFKVGDTVKVKVIKIDENGKISLSVKKAIEKKREDKKVIWEEFREGVFKVPVMHGRMPHEDTDSCLHLTYEQRQGLISLLRVKIPCRNICALRASRTCNSG